MATLPVQGIERIRLTIDGKGVTTLVGAYGCPLQCKYCINPHAWSPDYAGKWKDYTPEELVEAVKIDHLYFLTTGGGITFGGGESLLHADFIREFREICPPQWRITAETSLNVPPKVFEKALAAVNDFIVDIKDMDPEIYERYTGKNNAQVLINLKTLAQNKEGRHIKIRVPQIPEYNTEKDRNSSVELIKQMGFDEIEVFPYILR